MDLSETLAPKSDQVQADDLIAGPRTVTVTEVRKGSPEQPVDVFLAEFDRPYRPGKSMRRVLVAAWGAEAAAYVGRRMTIFNDPAVKWGGVAVGGVRISHLSHIDKPLSIALTVTRGKRAPFTVQPLPDAPTPPPIDVGSITDQAELKALWQTRPDLHDAIKARVNELKEEQS